MLNKFKPVILFLLLLSAIPLFSYEVVFDFEPEVDLESDVVAILPFTGTALADEVLKKELYDTVITQMVRDFNYNLKSVSKWVDKTYGNYSFSSPDDFMYKLLKGRMAVDKIVWGNLVYLEKEYIFTLYWYDVRSRKKSMYQRVFTGKKVKKKVSPGNIKKKKKLANSIVTSILKEFKVRNEKETRQFLKNFLIKKTKTKYFNFTTLSTGLEEYSEIPFIQYKGTPLEKTDDLFSNLFEYSFYKTGVIREYSDTLSTYLLHDTPDLKKYNYIVESELRVSNDFSILNIKVLDMSKVVKDRVIMDYNFPLADVSVASLEKLAQKNTQLVILNTLNSEEVKKVGVIDVNRSSKWVHSKMKGFKRSRGFGKGPTVYINDIFCGPLGSLEEQLLPFGQSTVTEGRSIYKVFVSPYWMNTLYFSEQDSILMELK